MSKTKLLVTLAATALTTLFIASSTFEPAAARDFGHSRSGSGMKSFSGGSWNGGARYSHTFRSPSMGSRTFAYRSHVGRHHHRHFRGGGFAVGYPYGYDDGYYGYSSGGCYWLRRRALTTGSSYWWNRYYDCINDY